jgi:hypothetical protein
MKGDAMGMGLLLRRRMLLGLLLAIGVGGGAAAQDAPAAIADAAALSSLLAGNTLYGANTYRGEIEFKWSEFHCPGGRSIYLRGFELYRGKWWLEGNEVCYSYEKIDPGQNFCFQMLPRGDGSYDMKERSETADDPVRVEVLGRVIGDPFNIQKLSGGSCDELSS